MNAKSGKGSSILVIIIAVILIVALLGMCSSGGGSSSGSASSKTCKSCHRTFTDSANKTSIAKTGMCSNCYSNFQWGQKAIGN